MLIVMTKLKSNDSSYPNDDTFSMYYTPDEVAQTIGNEKNQLSRLSLNCRSINANWDSLNQPIYNVTSQHCRFDFIGNRSLLCSYMMTLTIPYSGTIILNITVEMNQTMATVELVFMLIQTCRIAGETINLHSSCNRDVIYWSETKLNKICNIRCHLSTKHTASSWHWRFLLPNLLTLLPK